MKVTIVGAGIHGLTLAWALIRDGHAVTLLDQSDIPNPDSASFDQHRLIHDFNRRPDECPTISAAFDAWTMLARDIGPIYVETGAVRAWASRAEAEHALDELKETGVQCWLLDGQSLSEALPALRLETAGGVIMSRRGGVLLPDRIAAGLARWLSAHGAALRPRTAVASIDMENAAAVLANGEIVRTDLLFVATGAWTGHVIPSLAGQLGARRQIVTYLEPPMELRAAWGRSPAFVDLGTPEELWGCPPVAGTDLKLTAGCLGRAASPTKPGNRLVAHHETRMLLAFYRPYLPELETYRPLKTSACFYSTASDGQMFCRAIDGARQAVWVVAGYNGSDYKLAPAIALSLASRLRG